MPPLGGDKAFKMWTLVGGFLVMMECVLEAEGCSILLFLLLDHHV